MNSYNNEEVTKKIKSMLSSYRLVGIASRERFADDKNIKGLKNKGPENLIKNYQSVISFGDGTHKKDKNSTEVLGFDYLMKELISPLEVVEYLKSLGYKTHIAHKVDLNISHVNAALKSGLGELSPVNSLVIKGYGLTSVFQTIVTEAPLVQDELPKPKSHCIGCNLCLKVCPIRSVANAPGDLRKCNCSKCNKICPV